MRGTQPGFGPIHIFAVTALNRRVDCSRMVHLDHMRLSASPLNMEVPEAPGRPRLRGEQRRSPRLQGGKLLLDRAAGPRRQEVAVRRPRATFWGDAKIERSPGECRRPPAPHRPVTLPW